MRDNVFSAANQQGSLRQSADDPSETIRRIPQMTKELSILLALLFTDGCVSPKKEKSFRIYFLNKSKVLIELFKESIMKAFDVPEDRVLIRKRGEYFQAVVNSKLIGQTLVDKFGTFRTLRFKDGMLPDAKLPVKSLTTNGWVKEFLQVAFSCDGGVALYPAFRKGSRGGTQWLIRTVFLACSHQRLRSHYAVLLKSLGIQVRDVAGDDKIKIETESEIKKFCNSIGFVEGVTMTHHSKFWRDSTKQEVLENLIASYGNPSVIYNLPRFHEVMR